MPKPSCTHTQHTVNTAAPSKPYKYIPTTSHAQSRTPNNHVQHPIPFIAQQFLAAGALMTAEMQSADPGFDAAMVIPYYMPHAAFDVVARMAIHVEARGQHPCALFRSDVSSRAAFEASHLKQFLRSWAKHTDMSLREFLNVPADSLPCFVPPAATVQHSWTAWSIQTPTTA
jgi:hypothetical protein